VLDNPIWHALSTKHARFAEGGALARRYQPAVTPLAGLGTASPEAYDALAKLLGQNGMVGLFLDAPPELPSGWTLVHHGQLAQMVHDADAPPEADPGLTRLTDADIPAMADLVRRTEPGPFGARTPELGTYLGIFNGGRLVAMAGERVRFGNYAEVSAVCTDPEFRGRGLACKLVTAIVREMKARDETPVLHVRADNEGAIRLYERLGFRTRRNLFVAVVKH